VVAGKNRKIRHFKDFGFAGCQMKEFNTNSANEMIAKRHE